MAKDKEKKKTVETPVEASGAEKTNAADSDGITLSREELEKAREEIMKLKSAAEQAKRNAEEAMTDAQRIQAEFSNFRKRNANIRAESIDDGIRETIKALLPVLDNFDRALQNSDGSAFAKGMEQIKKQLVDCLEKCGMQEVEAEGSFDPDRHEAVLQDSESDAPSGTITEVLQKGYRVKGRIVRHTMVKVRT